MAKTATLNEEIAALEEEMTHLKAGFGEGVPAADLKRTKAEIVWLKKQIAARKAGEMVPETHVEVGDHPWEVGLKCQCGWLKVICPDWERPIYIPVDGRNDVILRSVPPPEVAAPAATTLTAAQPTTPASADEHRLQLVGRRVRLAGVDYRVVRYNRVDGKHLVRRSDRDDAPEESRKLRRGKYELLEAGAHELVCGASADDPLCAKCGQVQPGGIRSFEQMCANEACGHRVAFGLGRASGVGSATTTARGEVLLAANQTPTRPDYRDGNGSDDSGDEERSGGSSGGSGSESDDESGEDADEQAAVLPGRAPAAAPNQAQPLPPPPPRSPLPPPPPETPPNANPVVAAAPNPIQPHPQGLAAAVAHHQRTGAALAGAAALALAAAPPHPMTPPPQPPPPRPPPAGPPPSAPPAAAAAANQAAPPPPLAQPDALRPRLGANPPADLVKCTTDAALIAYRNHTNDRDAQALPPGWVTTAGAALNENVGRLTEQLVDQTREAISRGVPGVCIGPLNKGKCRYECAGKKGRAKVYLWDAAGLQARAQIYGTQA